MDSHYLLKIYFSDSFFISHKNSDIITERFYRTYLLI